MATDTELAQEFRLLALDLVVPSGMNPRKTFDPKSMEDLTASVKEKGVIVPILVRPVGAVFEIVAGERRFRAAKKAGLMEIPAIIRDLSDDQALEAAVIENLQRADVHPLEEADGYQKVLKRGRLKVEDLAARVGKSVSYIWQRIKLLELIEPARKAFLADEITAGHAVLIARLTSQQQKDALEVCLPKAWIEHAGADGSTERHAKTLLPVRVLSSWIQDTTQTDLRTAPWDLQDPKLFVTAGACSTCPKRSGNAPALFPEVQSGDTCTDRACFRAKLKAWYKRKKQELATTGVKVYLVTETQSYLSDTEADEVRSEVLWPGSWKRAASKKCDHRGLGIMVGGKDRGQVIDVCPKEGCSIHSSPKGRHNRGTPSVDAQSQKEQKLERQKEALKERATELARMEILGEIVKCTTRIGREELELWAATCGGLPYVGHDVAEPDWMPPALDEASKASKASDQDLARFLVASALNDDLSSYSDARELYRLAKHHNVDFKAIEKKALQSVVYDRTHKDRMQRWKGLKASGNTRFEEMTCQLCGRVEKEQSKGGWHWIRKNDKSKVALCNDCERLEKK